MKLQKIIKIMFFLGCASLSSTALAWNFYDNVAITGMIQFESGIGRDYTIIKFSNGSQCRILHTEKELLALTISIYMSGKTAGYVCYDTEEDVGSSGILSHRLHRIISQ